jgi:uncharacterized protein YodC (DUF2158 family)
MENKYKVGTIITAQKTPNSRLIIRRYWKRIYYCETIDGADSKLQAYFERELLAPEATR